MAVRLPGLLLPDLTESRRLHMTAGSLTVKMIGSSEAALTLPEDEADVKIHDWVTIYTEEGLAGIFRITNVSQPLKKQVDLTLLHGIDILSDSVWAEQTEFSGTKEAFLRALLNQQTQLVNGQRPWVLGVCEDTATVRKDINYDRLSTLLEGMNEDGGDYWFTYDMSSFPWVLNYVHVNNTVVSEFRLTRNIRSATVTYNDADLCTRLFLTVSTKTEETVPTKRANPAYISEQATPNVPRIITENITVSSVDSRIKQYNNTAAQEDWGIVVKTADIDTTDDILNGHFESADAWAASFLARRSAPSVQIQIDGDDLFALTGDIWDRTKVGRLCQVALPAYGKVFQERVVSVTYPELVKKQTDVPVPYHVTVSLSNMLPRFTESLAAAEKEASTASRSSRSTARAQTKDEKELTTWSKHVQWQGAALDGSGIMTLYESGIDMDATGGVKIFSLEEGLQGLYGELVVQAGQIAGKVGTDALNGYLQITDLATSIGNVMIGPNGKTVAANIVTGINSQTGTGIVQINGDFVNITGLVRMTDLEAVEGKIDTVRAENITAGTYLSAATGKFNTLWVESPGQNGATHTAQVNNAINSIRKDTSLTNGLIGFEYTTLANPSWQKVNFNIADTAYYLSHVGIASVTPAGWTNDGEGGGYYNLVTAVANDGTTDDATVALPTITVLSDLGTGGSATVKAYGPAVDGTAYPVSATLTLYLKSDNDYIYITRTNGTPTAGANGNIVARIQNPGNGTVAGIQSVTPAGWANDGEGGGYYNLVTGTANNGDTMNTSVALPTITVSPDLGTGSSATVKAYGPSVGGSVYPVSTALSLYLKTDNNYIYLTKTNSTPTAGANGNIVARITNPGNGTVGGIASVTPAGWTNDGQGGGYYNLVTATPNSGSASSASVALPTITVKPDIGTGSSATVKAYGPAVDGTTYPVSGAMNLYLKTDNNYIYLTKTNSTPTAGANGNIVARITNPGNGTVGGIASVTPAGWTNDGQGGGYYNLVTATPNSGRAVNASIALPTITVSPDLGTGSSAAVKAYGPAVGGTAYPVSTALSLYLKTDNNYIYLTKTNSTPTAGANGNIVARITNPGNGTAGGIASVTPAGWTNDGQGGGYYNLVTATPNSGSASSATVALPTITVSPDLGTGSSAAVKAYGPVVDGESYQVSSVLNLYFKTDNNYIYLTKTNSAPAEGTSGNIVARITNPATVNQPTCGESTVEVDDNAIRQTVNIKAVASNGASNNRNFTLERNTYDSGVHCVNLKEGSTVIGRISTETVYTAGRDSVTVTAIDRLASCSFDEDAQTARQTVRVTLSNGKSNTFEGNFDDIYRAGRAGTSIDTTIEYEADLSSGGSVFDTAEELDTGDPIALDVSDIYQRGVADATPAVTHTYTYSAGGGLIDIYRLYVILGQDTGIIRINPNIAFYPNTQVETNGTVTYQNVTYTKVIYNGTTYLVLPDNLIESGTTTPSPSDPSFGGRTGIKDLKVTVTNVSLTRIVHTGPDDITVTVWPDTEGSPITMTSSKISASQYGSMATNGSASYYFNSLAYANNYYGSHQASDYSSNLNHKAVFTISYSDGTEETVTVAFDSYAYAEAPKLLGYEFVDAYNYYNMAIPVEFTAKNGSSVYLTCLTSGFDSLVVNQEESALDYIDGDVTYVYNSSYPATMTARFLVCKHYTNGDQYIVIQKMAKRKEAPPTITGITVSNVFHVNGSGINQCPGNIYIKVRTKASNRYVQVLSSGTASAVYRALPGSGDPNSYLSGGSGYHGYHSTEDSESAVEHKLHVTVSWSNGNTTTDDVTFYTRAHNNYDNL